MADNQHMLRLNGRNLSDSTGRGRTRADRLLGWKNVAANAKQTLVLSKRAELVVSNKI